MKKQYVKSATGVLVLATEEQIKDATIEKFEVEEREPDNSDPMKQLAAEIRAMATDTKTTVEKFREQIEAFNKFAQRGLPIPDADPMVGLPKDQGQDIFERNAKMAGCSVQEAKDLYAHYDLAIQGKSLQDKLTHPNHQTDEATRIEMAKYYILLLRAIYDPRAKAKFIDTYGEFKTNIGDAGNTFPLPKPIESEILAFAREASIILQEARIWPMVSDKMGIPAQSSSTTVGWGNTTANSDPAATEVELEANELSAYSSVRNATLADTVSDIVGWINQCLAEAAGQELDNQAFNGTGTPFYGLLGSSGAGYSVVLAGSLISGMDDEDLSNMISKLDGLKKQGAKFFMHGQLIHIVRTIKTTDGLPIFMPGNVAGAAPPTIWGYPYREVIKMPSDQAANTAYLIFGNMTHFGIGRRLDVATLSVNPYLGWTTNRTAFKLYQRWGMKVGLRNGFVRLLTSA